jgi:hypothetical protein
MLGVTNLFAVPQQMQGFDVDDAFTTSSIGVAETKIGVDGILSAGFVYNTSPMEISLQADSPSVGFFETLYAASLAAQDVYFLFGVIRVPALSKVYTLTTGVLKNYDPSSDAKKILQPRKFAIEWQSIIGAAL